MNARFARQISLTEVGPAGQARIAGSASRAGAGDARAMAVALDYLERAGACVDDAGLRLDVPASDAVELLAGRPELIEAAAFLVGSLCATERLATALGFDSGIVSVPMLGPSEP